MIDPFDNPTLETGERDNHVISTDHPYLKSLGLSVFTTGNLYKWYNTKDAQEKYTNRPLVTNCGIDTLLGGPLMNSDGWGEWYGWRKHFFAITGNYKIQKWDDWSWTWAFLISKYTQDDLAWDTWVQDTAAGLAVDYVTEIENDGDFEDDINFATVHAQFPGSDEDKSALIDASENPIISIIQMNRWMNSFKRLFPGDTWINSMAVPARNLKAMDIFLQDIKGSKFGHVAFSGLVPFNVNIADGGVQCIKEEYVTYKLHLYDDFTPRVGTNFAVLKNTSVAGIRRDASGRAYATSVDGEYTDPDPNNPSDIAVGDTERMWNPITNKWESGTVNMLAYVDTPGGKIDAAYNNPTVDNLLHSDIGLDLDGDPLNHFAPSSGYVMPIYQQNSNPMQWQPNYARSSGCRIGPDKNEKAKVIGFNFNPLKEYLHGSMVMISKIGSIWHITDMGSGIHKEEDVEVDAGFDGKWEFHYLATNSINFFVAREPFITYGPGPSGKGGKSETTLDSGTRDAFKVDPARVERAFHQRYYYGDPLNSQAGVHDDDYPGSSYNHQFSTIGIIPIWSRDGWWQFSSFDFMDKQIGGTRQKNALGTTQATLDAAGRSIPLGDLTRNPAHSGPFFGCVFPDGYRTNEQLTEYWTGGNRPFTIGVFTNGNIVDGPERDLALASIKVFNTTLIANTKGNPFLDAGGDLDNYSPARNDLSAAVLESNPKVEFSEGEDTYARTPFHGPSMFFMESEAGSQDLKQLPADIGTLAHSESSGGMPFQNIHALDKFHKGYTFGYDGDHGLAPLVAVAFNSSAWLAKTDLTGAIEYSPDGKHSAFDFTPKRPNTIQFRPLKLETYAQFFPYPKFTYGLPTWGFPPSSGRVTFSSEGRRAMISKERQASDVSMKRNEDAALAGGAYHWDTVYSKPDDEGSGLHFNVDIPRTVFRKYGTDALEAGFFPSYQGRVHQRYFWNIFQNRLPGLSGVPWQNCPDEWSATCDAGAYRGANAYGVIGAACTVRANLSITFSTEQNIGMDSEGWSHVSRGGGGQNFITRWEQRPTWGGTACSYNTNRTTELHATIYHQWPRTQTKFDPRYFAVHHFNPRPDLNPFDADGDLRDSPMSGVLFRNLDDSNSKYMIDTRDTDQGGVTQWSVDMREPSAFSHNGLDAGNQASYLPQVLGLDTAVWLDANSDNGYKMMPKEFWDIDHERVGRLLPYRYTRRTLGVPWVSGSSHWLTADSPGVKLSKDIEDDTLASDLVNEFILVSVGSGYQVGDIVGNKDLGVMFSVMEVDIEAQDAAGNPIPNPISVLKVFDVGRDIPVSKSFPHGELLDKDTRAGSMGIPIGNVATNGNGFEGFFVNSKVVMDMGIDQKPLYVDGSNGRIFRLSAAADTTGFKNGTGQVGSSFGFVTTPTQKTISIDEEYRSPNGKYDVFFHFHNDITHTWGTNHSDWSDGKNPYDNDEQYIQTSITSL